MRRLLRVLLKWVGQRLVWFVLIVAILMAGAYLKAQFDEFHEIGRASCRERV